MVTSSGRPLLRGSASLDATGSSSDSNYEDEEKEGQQKEGSGRAAAASGVLATAEPPAATMRDGLSAEAAEATLEMPAPPPWSSLAEMEAMARFGAAVLAFHTRLGLQLRHVMH